MSKPQSLRLSSNITTRYPVPRSPSCFLPQQVSGVADVLGGWPCPTQFQNAMHIEADASQPCYSEYQPEVKTEAQLQTSSFTPLFHQKQPFEMFIKEMWHSSVGLQPSFSFQEALLKFCHWGDVDKEPLPGLGKLRSGDRNHQGERARLLSLEMFPAKTGHASHLKMMLQDLKTGWKLDKYHGLSNFWFYFSVVEPSCKQVTQRSRMQ